ncbi:Uncharacterised protein [Klebsiella pneumoniae]|nr:Uncharacterised protein [Klebsiella pneumoniae]
MLLAVPAPTVASVCTYWALKLIASAVPALAPVTLFRIGKLLASLILTLVPSGTGRTGVIAVGQLHADAAGAVAGLLRARVSLSTLTPKKPMRTSVGVGQKTGIEKRFAWPPVVPLP